MPITTDQSRACTAELTAGTPRVGLSGTGNSSVDCQCIDVLLSLQHPRSQGCDAMRLFVMGQVRELPFEALHVELHNALPSISPEGFKQFGDTLGMA